MTAQIVGKMDGYIRKVNQTQGSFNDDGEPIAASVTYGSYIPCKYHANTLNNKGRYQDGEFTASEYIITTREMNFAAEQIELSNMLKNVVCQKPVQSLEVLESVMRVRITI